MSSVFTFQHSWITSLFFPFLKPPHITCLLLRINHFKILRFLGRMQLIQSFNTQVDTLNRQLCFGINVEWHGLEELYLLSSWSLWMSDFMPLWNTLVQIEKHHSLEKVRFEQCCPLIEIFLLTLKTSFVKQNNKTKTHVFFLRKSLNKRNKNSDYEQEL